MNKYSNYKLLVLLSINALLFSACSSKENIKSVELSDDNKQQLLVINQVSNKMLLSAKQTDTYIQGVITNTLRNASHAQVASNAILKLSADVSSIFSIISAADYDSTIYGYAMEATAVAEASAKIAEYLAQQTIELSAYTAELSASKLSLEAAEISQLSKYLLASSAKGGTIKSQQNELHQRSIELKLTLELLRNKVAVSAETSKKIVEEMTELSEKLMSSAELINVLSNIIQRSKPRNPLITEELVMLSSQADVDAKNAVALSTNAKNISIVTMNSLLKTEPVAMSTLQEAITLLKEISDLRDE